MSKPDEVKEILAKLASIRAKLEKFIPVQAMIHGDYMRTYMRVCMYHRRKHEHILTDANGKTFAERRALMLERAMADRKADPAFIAAREEYLRKKAIIRAKRQPLEHEVRRLQIKLRLLRKEGW